MSTSNSIDFNLTARQVIEYALRKINILGQGQAADGDAAEEAMRELNLLLKEWQKHEQIWILTEGYVTPIASTGAYTLTPIPHRIIDCRYRNSSSIDTPMYEMTRQEYFDLPDKTSTGVPTQFYFDPQRGESVLYIWPLLSSVSTETIRVTYQRRFEDVDDLANNLDVRQEHLGLVGMNLAARLADTYGRSGDSISRIISRAESMLQEALDEDRPEMIRFMPDELYYG